MDVEGEFWSVGEGSKVVVGEQRAVEGDQRLAVVIEGQVERMAGEVIVTFDRLRWAHGRGGRDQCSQDVACDAVLTHAG